MESLFAPYQRSQFSWASSDTRQSGTTSSLSVRFGHGSSSTERDTHYAPSHKSARVSQSLSRKASGEQFKPAHPNLSRKASKFSWVRLRSRTELGILATPAKANCKEDESASTTTGSRSRWRRHKRPKSDPQSTSRISISHPIPLRPDHPWYLPPTAEQSPVSCAEELTKSLTAQHLPTRQPSTSLSVTPPETVTEIRLGDLDPDKRGPAFARIDLNGWGQIIPRHWTDERLSDECSDLSEAHSVYSQDNGEEEVRRVRKNAGAEPHLDKRHLVLQPYSQSSVLVPSEPAQPRQEPPFWPETPERCDERPWHLRYDFDTWASSICDSRPENENNVRDGGMSSGNRVARWKDASSLLLDTETVIDLVPAPLRPGRHVSAVEQPRPRSCSHARAPSKGRSSSRAEAETLQPPLPQAAESSASSWSTVVCSSESDGEGGGVVTGWGSVPARQDAGGGLRSHGATTSLASPWTQGSSPANRRLSHDIDDILDLYMNFDAGGMQHADEHDGTNTRETGDKPKSPSPCVATVSEEHGKPDPLLRKWWPSSPRQSSSSGTSARVSTEVYLELRQGREQQDQRANTTSAVVTVLDEHGQTWI